MVVVMPDNVFSLGYRRGQGVKSVLHLQGLPAAHVRARPSWRARLTLGSQTSCGQSFLQLASALHYGPVAFKVVGCLGTPLHDLVFYVKLVHFLVG